MTDNTFKALCGCSCKVHTTKAGRTLVIRSKSGMAVESVNLPSAYETGSPTLWTLLRIRKHEQEHFERFAEKFSEAAELLEGISGVAQEVADAVREFSAKFEWKSD